MNTKNLKEDYEFFLRNQKKFYEEYPGKFLVIKDGSVIGVYESERVAYIETVKENLPGTFIIQRSSPDSSEVQVFHSRVIALK